eukprot:365533-Chlamydomonas_euryale.AAC.16
MRRARCVYVFPPYQRGVIHWQTSAPPPIKHTFPPPPEPSLLSPPPPLPHPCVARAALAHLQEDVAADVVHGAALRDGLGLQAAHMPPHAVVNARPRVQVRRASCQRGPHVKGTCRRASQSDSPPRCCYDHSRRGTHPSANVVLVGDADLQVSDQQLEKRVRRGHVLRCACAAGGSSRHARRLLRDDLPRKPAQWAILYAGVHRERSTFEG